MDRVLLGMSGGVDSSVAAIMLMEQGYEVIGATMKLWDPEDEEGQSKCCGDDSILDAKRVCDKLGIPHYTLNLKEEFQRCVINNFIEEYAKANTPNPCIECNKFLKFNYFYRKAKELDCKYIATGHYAKRENMKKHLKLCVISSIFFALLVYLIWGNTALTVSNIKISSSRIPIAFSGFRIAQVSDLHNAEFGKGNRKLLELLSESKPDIIAITGDLVDAGHTDIGVALDFAKEAVKIAPVYYVTGNHEASLSQYDELKIELKTIGVIVLEDEAVQLKHDTEEITLIGLSDPDFTIKGDIFGEVPAMVSTKLNNLADDENSYTILLSHRPELFESYVHCNIDLVLSGHAHGGQFRLPFIGGLIAPNQGLFPQYDAGLYTSGSTNMIVSRGLGNSIIPIRFNNRPEVVVIELLSIEL